jgi:hypothetical protein
MKNIYRCLIISPTSPENKNAIKKANLSFCTKISIWDNTSKELTAIE